MKLTRMIIFLKTALLAAMTALILILPAYGQQDVNPEWYPWPDAPKPAAKPVPAKIREHRHARVTHNNHASATQLSKKQTPAQEPLRAAEALPPKK